MDRHSLKKTCILHVSSLIFSNSNGISDIALMLEATNNSETSATFYKTTPIFMLTAERSQNLTNLTMCTEKMLPF